MPVEISLHPLLTCHLPPLPPPAIVIALTTAIFLAIPFQRYSLSSHHAPARWLIPNLIAEHSVNLIAGTSRTGKTALALTMLDDWLTNGSALDYQVASTATRPRPAALVMDRLTRDLQQAITTLDCQALAAPRSFPIIELTQDIQSEANRLSQSDSASALAILKTVRDRLPFPPTLLLIEGIDRLNMGSHLNPQVVSRFLVECQEFCRTWDCTIIGTIGTMKQKSGDNFLSPIDLISGPPVWGSGVQTVIVLTLPEGSFRLSSQPANLIRKFCIYVPSCRERLGYLRMTDSGRMELLDPDASSGPLAARSESLLSQRLEQEPAGKEFPKSIFLAWGEEYDLSSRSVERWLKSALELGSLLKVGTTRDSRYQKPVTQ